MLTVILETDDFNEDDILCAKQMFLVENRIDEYDAHGTLTRCFHDYEEANDYAYKIHRKYHTEDVVILN